MEKLKIGATNFWDNSGANWLIQEEFIGTLIENNFPVDEKVYNPEIEECDIVFRSVFGEYKDLKGLPIEIYYTGENVNFRTFKEHYTLSFHIDNDTNLYYPLWQFTYDDFVKYRKNRMTISKTKFCSFIVSNPTSNFRNSVYFYLNENYKQIHSFGRAYNNVGWLLPKEMELAIPIIEPYKFNLCFENTQAYDPEDAYITEKIMNAYIYGSVPIYWGSERIAEWFNPKSFINCNGKTKEEILDLVKYYDNNDDAYYQMLNEKPFKEDIDWKEFRHKRYIEFISKILKDNGKI